MTAKMKTQSTIPPRETRFPYELDYFNHLLARESRKEELFSFKARSPQVLISNFLAFFNTQIKFICLAEPQEKSDWIIDIIG